MVQISIIGDDGVLLQAVTAWEIEGASAFSSIAKQAIQINSGLVFRIFHMVADYSAITLTVFGTNVEKLIWIKNLGIKALLLRYLVADVTHRIRKT